MFALTFVAALRLPDMSELDDTSAIPPVGEEIHMPEPSILPLINAAALAITIVSLTLSWYLVALGGVRLPVTTVRWIADVRRDIADLPLDHCTTSEPGWRVRPRRIESARGRPSGGHRKRRPCLAARYAAAFAAYLRDRGEQALGAAYDLGREAVAAHLSVLDLAEAHHAALRSALESGGARRRRHPAGGRGLPAREPVDLRERPPRLHRGPGGRAPRARARRAAARAGRRLGGDQLLDDGRRRSSSSPPTPRARSSPATARPSPCSRPTRACGR